MSYDLLWMLFCGRPGKGNERGMRRDADLDAFFTQRWRNSLQLLNILPRRPIPVRERIWEVLVEDFLELLWRATPRLPLLHQLTDRLEEKRGPQRL